MNEADTKFVAELLEAFDQADEIPASLAVRSWSPENGGEVIDIIGVCSAIKEAKPAAYEALTLARENNPPPTEMDGVLAEIKENADAETSAALCALMTESAAGETPTAESAQSSRKRSQATEIADLVIGNEHYGLKVDEAGDVFLIDHHGPNVARPLRGSRLSAKSMLAADYRVKHGKVPSAAALTDALTVLEGLAAEAAPVELALRVGRAPSGEIVIDLAQPTGQVAIVGPDGVRLAPRSPVIFRQTNLTLPLPTPIGDDPVTMTDQASSHDRASNDRGRDDGDDRDGDDQRLSFLRNALNVKEEDWPVLIAFLVAALIPDIPHPLLYLHGIQGTGKSTTASLLSRVLDPTAAPLRSAPRNDESWAVQAAASWVVALDNLSSVQEWLSDALCRAVTGDGWVRRQLYTNSDVSVLKFHRVVILTSIDAGALRGDLAERLVAVELERIDPTQRMTETEIEQAFQQHQPRILAQLLELLSDVLRVLPSVELDELPRMADFARIVAAVDVVLGTNALATYLATGSDLADDVIDADPVASAIVTLLGTRESWTGTAQQLLKEITPEGTIPKGWPTQANLLSGALKRVAPALRTTGILADQGIGRDRRTWHISKKESACDSPSPSSPPAPALSIQGDDAVTMTRHGDDDDGWAALLDQANAGMYEPEPEYAA